MTPQQQVDTVLAQTSPGENPMPPIPDFLLVRNRKPLTRKQQARVAAAFKGAAQSVVDRVDYRKPKGTSWEDWDAHLVQVETTRQEKTTLRVAELKERYGDRPRVPRAGRRVRLGVSALVKRRAGAPAAGSKNAMVAELLVRSNGCTTADALAATGWPAISMPAAARIAGLVLRKERVDGVLRYYGSR